MVRQPTLRYRFARIASRKPAITDRLRMLRVHGGRVKYHHEILGTNSRLDALQAAILRAKLPYLDRWADARRNHADRYRVLFENLRLDSVATCPPVPRAGFHHVYNQFTIRSPFRDELKAFLRQAGVPTEIYYPLCLHLQKVFAHLGYGEGQLPVAERASLEVLSLPVFPELSSSQQELVVKTVADFSAARRTT